MTKIPYGSCATDGHAKNFSVFIEPGGRFSLTPLYDVLSAYPVMGHGPNRLAPEKARMSMAAAGRIRHYRWAQIQRRRWLDTANACDLGPLAEALIAQLVEHTPAVLQQVARQLPEKLPPSVAEPIFAGLEDATSRLRDARAVIFTAETQRRREFLVLIILKFGSAPPRLCREQSYSARL